MVRHQPLIVLKFLDHGRCLCERANPGTDEGWQVDRPSTVMSTAEAVTVATAIMRESAFFPSGFDPVSRMPGHLLGVVMKDDEKDRQRLLGYWDGPVQRRSKTGGPLWKKLYDRRSVLNEAAIDSPIGQKD